ncbi:putative DNA-binding protein [Ligilactobacillus cholophilus]|uniref:putative DNA-binding protein n=1 Tax=Ligilactobacillus cholophilus TaxID=3050131 RepID=UPI0025AF22E7|nr:putative DNA-binding protein [Ligilactobacillus cholophilus]
MEIEKTNRINALFEFYEPLLTTKQMDYLAQYYRDDYSLGEIAENYDVSRQAVYDNIKRTEKILEEYESKLHLYENFKKNASNLDALLNYIQANYADDKKLLYLAHQLESIEE